MRRFALVLLMSILPALPAAAQDWALGGFDPVGYVSAGRPVPGRSDIATMWRGMIWHFASEENRTRFEADPRAYAPRLGGMCPLSIIEGDPEPGDPRHFLVRQDGLYLFRSAEAGRKVRGNPDEVLGRARAAWAQMQ
ncbi:MAG: YHS domain-containing (seleno)protein [Paracoccus sp. (in: a-proteobacteria)]|uniref:YHS domain-containing (seleno)protein n=1 Tax=Paracoccus sp. TaxID=267 RepID=UPI002E82EFA6|nr:YHS domain-containing (seleno)protein [Pseudomonadota bacterium]